MSALLALIQAKKQALAAQRKGSTEKLNDGTTTLRIMGSWKGEDQEFWHDFGKHFIKTPEGKMAESYICTKKTFGDPCPICDAIAEAKSQNLPEALGKLVGDCGAAARILVNAINPQHPKEPHKVHIYDLPSSVFSQIIDQADQYMKMGVELIGPNGRDIYITRTGKGMQTKYTVTPAPISTPIPEVKELNNITEFVDQVSAEQRTKALSAFRHLIGSPAPAAGLPSGMPASLLAGATPVAGGVPAGLLAGAKPAMAVPSVDPAAAAAAAVAHQQQMQAIAAQQAAAQAAAAKAEQDALAQQAAQMQAIAAQQAAAAAQAAQLQAAQAAHLQAQAALAQQETQFADVPELDAIAALTPEPVAAAPIATPDLAGIDPDLDAMLNSLM